jgi:hypothetical protein
VGTSTSSLGSFSAVVFCSAFVCVFIWIFNHFDTKDYWLDFIMAAQYFDLSSYRAGTICYEKEPTEEVDAS